ncbi:flagellar transcriptional regulator FlhD [Pusillimonas caeni]|uniref:flagellar transcriptional regulator FlhD n=1 Tax=Pusillimonas caeni TaxID=1348472 RepID=UPI000E59C74E|nr:flagellar transcriptional regulator FlhD [Pusillimonas caeni]TFL14431.1 flagellar transcriptional regulator FlhD [Pusillimonas caeni]
MNQIDPDVEDIRELNLSYLILAQRMLRTNFARGMYRLGLEEDAATILAGFSLPQVMKLASTQVLLCSFRLNDFQLLSALDHSGLDGSLLSTHASVILSNLTSTIEAPPSLHSDMHLRCRTV